jgi:hypothetical protein
MDQIPEVGTAAVFGDAAFDDKPGTIIKPAGTPARQIVYRVLEQQEADMNAFADARDRLYEQTLNSKRDQAFLTFSISARQRYEKEGKIETYNDRIDSFLKMLARRG